MDCWHCSGSQVYVDPDFGEEVCYGCGTVVSDMVFETEDKDELYGEPKERLQRYDKWSGRPSAKVVPIDPKLLKVLLAGSDWKPVEEREIARRARYKSGSEGRGSLGELLDEYVARKASSEPKKKRGRPRKNPVGPTH